MNDKFMLFFMDFMCLVFFIILLCGGAAIICIPRKKDEEDENISKCHQCGREVSFERHTKDLPEEYEVCYGCDDHVCLVCVDWKHMNKVDTTTPICRKCAAAGYVEGIGFPE
jgi:hypothetical protein